MKHRLSNEESPRLERSFVQKYAAVENARSASTDVGGYCQKALVDNLQIKTPISTFFSHS